MARAEDREKHVAQIQRQRATNEARKAAEAAYRAMEEHFHAIYHAIFAMQDAGGEVPQAWIDLVDDIQAARERAHRIAGHKMRKQTDGEVSSNDRCVGCGLTYAAIRERERVG